jgi:Rps23 Pro-64 3,4-dihydroxylase Tpa1-like proline 4-hydroxylase
MPLEADNESVLELERLGDELRAGGCLVDARAVFERLLSIAPGHVKAERLLASFSQVFPRLVSTPGGLKPAPFVRVSEFLPRRTRDAIFEFLVSKASDFRAARTNEGLSRNLRRSLCRPNCFHDLDPQLVRAFEDLLFTHFVNASRQLLIPAFEPTFIEIHGLIYRNGDFFQPHRDTGPNNTRRMTFVLNLHSDPKRFVGGDLLLYDTYCRSSSDGLDGPFFAPTRTRLVPEDNRLILFPSEFYHEVTLVDVDDDIRHARFAVNGWFHTTPAEGNVDLIARTPY